MRSERDDTQPVDLTNPTNPCNLINLVYFFVSTPQATLGPPLTPDFGSPVIP